MATKTGDVTSGCILQWEIENISHNWLKKGEKIKSPPFLVDALEGTKWSLWLCPMGYTDENYVSIYLNREIDCGGPNAIEVLWQFSFIGNDGSFLEKGTPRKQSFAKGDVWGLSFFKKREIVFFTDKEKFLPEDTLTLQCKIWNQDKMPVMLKHLYVRTSFSTIRRYFAWKIDKISTLKYGLRRKFKDNLIDFDLIFNEGFDRLDIDVISFDDNIKYISCNSWIIDSEGKRENCGIKKYFNGDLQKGVLSTLFSINILHKNKSRYLPNDVLSLEFVFSTIEYSVTRKKFNFENKPCVMKEKAQNTTVMAEDFKSMYNNGLFSDTMIHTLTKTFPAHKNILSARSPVFSKIFGNDMMKKSTLKKICRNVYITDLEDDTVHRMLLYIYTDSLEDLQLESASKLYDAAYKYEILSLRNRCSSFIKDNLCPSKACSILALADLHQDNDLKSFVEYYILDHDTEEWEDFMNTSPKLAMDIMYGKCSYLTRI